MKTRTVAVIGAGQLGSRHLQALGRVEDALDIHIVDPSHTSLAVARERYAQVDPHARNALHELTSVDALPRHVDLAIVATTANARLAVLRDLTAKLDLSALLLEKVLFQDLDEYPVAEKLLGGLASRTWVNCAQRLWPFFQGLRQRFHDDPELEVVISGTQWGLGCNAVHNTDIAEYLWSGTPSHRARLDATLHDSKRPGFNEFTGELVTRTSGGGVLRQRSYAGGSAPFTIFASHPCARMVWDVAASRLLEAGEQTNWEWKTSECRAPFQSDLTARVVADVFAGRDCGLPAFAAAAKTHVATLEALIRGSRENGIELGRVCPVT